MVVLWIAILKFLFGRGKLADRVYKLLFCGFVIVGAAVNLGAVIGFSDAMIFAMVFPNMIGLFILAPVVRKEFVLTSKKSRIRVNSCLERPVAHFNTIDFKMVCTL